MSGGESEQLQDAYSTVLNPLVDMKSERSCEVGSELVAINVNVKIVHSV